MIEIERQKMEKLSELHQFLDTIDKFEMTDDDQNIIEKYIACDIDINKTLRKQAIDDPVRFNELNRNV